MTKVIDFPGKYTYIHDHVESIVIYDDITRSDIENIDFVVHFKSDLSYVLTAFTPENVRKLMIDEGISHFVSRSLVIVSSISIDAIIDVIDSCIKLSLENNIPFNHFGTLQRYYNDL